MLPFGQTSEIMKTCFLKGAFYFWGKARTNPDQKINAVKAYLEGVLLMKSAENTKCLPILNEGNGLRSYAY